MSNYISFGIDLGTTNSCISYFDGDRVNVFQNNDQMNVTPSVVRIEKAGRIIVGRRAYASKMANPSNVASEFKRWMGQKDRYKFESSGRQMSAEELSAEVLKALIEDVRLQRGESVEAAVITVPAAFGQLQCEATARAANLAGLAESPLLQEPIAAAIAYGISPSAKDQRWMVFDLGGGTFDVAVISSKDGRLTVLEHNGNNHLGGKDIDRLLVEQSLLPRLRKNFSLPSPDNDPAEYQRLVHRLYLKAEEAKIDLTRHEKVVVSLFELGEDSGGNEIEGELEISRQELEDLCKPLLEKCFDLCDEVLAGARVNAGGLDRILLVGGPTSMPIVRNTLKDRFKAELDCSIDPMTIVSQGAAIHAAAIERKETKTHAVGSSLADGVIRVTLAHDSVCSSIQCPLDGRVENADGANIAVKIDAESGHWTSGWLTPNNGTFELKVPLLEGKTCKFWLYGRDEHGKSIEIEPQSFVIRHGLAISAPPLPHTISVEIVKVDGSTELEPIFKRGTPLPSEVTKTFRADRTLSPKEDNQISIKLWEGEVFSEPDANELVGSLLITGADIHRVLPEGSEIELTVNIDISRLMKVIAFIPRLNIHITENVYVPERDEEEFGKVVKCLPRELEQQYDRLNQLEDCVSEEDANTLTEVRKLRKRLEELDVEVDTREGASDHHDPDKAKRLVEESKNIRASLSKIENKVNSSESSSIQMRELEHAQSEAEDIVESCGTPMDKSELAMLMREMERNIKNNDERGLLKIIDGFKGLYWRVLSKQEWFWGTAFKDLRDSTHNFTNANAAKQLVEIGNEALSRGDGSRLREVVRDLWKLLPKDVAELDRERAVRAGIRRL